MFKLDLEKAEEAEIKLPTSTGSSKKQETSRKTSTSALLTTPKPLIVWSTINCGKFFKTWEYQTTWPASWEICLQVKKQQLELDMEQQASYKSWKKYVKAVYCHPAYLTYMQRAHCEKRWAGWSTIWNQDCQEKYQQPRICRWHHSCAESEEEVKSLLMKVKEQREKVLNIQKTKIMASGLITSWQIDGETMETVTDFISWAPKSLQMVTEAMKLKDGCSLEVKLWQT